MLCASMRLAHAILSFWIFTTRLSEKVAGGSVSLWYHHSSFWGVCVLCVLWHNCSRSLESERTVRQNAAGKTASKGAQCLCRCCACSCCWLLIPGTLVLLEILCAIAGAVITEFLHLSALSLHSHASYSRECVLSCVDFSMPFHRVTGTSIERSDK